MKIVIDTNIVLAALMKPSKTQELIFSKKLELIAPEFCLREIKKYSELAAEKSGKTKEQMELSISVIFSEIQLAPKQDYLIHKQTARKLISDEKDWPFLALAIAEETPIWSNDKHFKEQKQVKVYTTKELLEKISPKQSGKAGTHQKNL